MAVILTLSNIMAYASKSSPIFSHLVVQHHQVTNKCLPLKQCNQTTD